MPEKQPKPVAYDRLVNETAARWYESRGPLFIQQSAEPHNFDAFVNDYTSGWVVGLFIDDLQPFQFEEFSTLCNDEATEEAHENSMIRVRREITRLESFQQFKADVLASMSMLDRRTTIDIYSEDEKEAARCIAEDRRGQK